MHLDLSPLFRSSVGYDHMSRLLESAFDSDQSRPSYPPYNILKKGEDSYRITMAVAGFEPEDLEIISHENVLTIRGNSKQANDDGEYLHKGIAARAFEQRFELADHVKVTDSSLTNGMLDIELVREIPEAMKPRKIEIKNGGAHKTIEQKKAS